VQVWTTRLGQKWDSENGIKKNGIRKNGIGRPGKKWDSENEIRKNGIMKNGIRKKRNLEKRDWENGIGKKWD
jgi:hypothetical protein